MRPEGVKNCKTNQLSKVGELLSSSEYNGAQSDKGIKLRTLLALSAS